MGESTADKLLRAVARKLSEKIGLTLTIRMLDRTDIQIGEAGPNGSCIHDTIMQFIADPRLFRVKITFAKNVNNLPQKRALVKRRCPEFIVSMREMENGNFEYLAQDITDKVADILKEILRIDLFAPRT